MVILGVRVIERIIVEDIVGVFLVFLFFGVSLREDLLLLLLLPPRGRVVSCRF